MSCARAQNRHYSDKSKEQVPYSKLNIRKRHICQQTFITFDINLSLWISSMFSNMSRIDIQSCWWMISKRLAISFDRNLSLELSRRPLEVKTSDISCVNFSFLFNWNIWHAYLKVIQYGKELQEFKCGSGVWLSLIICEM